MSARIGQFPRLLVLLLLWDIYLQVSWTPPGDNTVKFNNLLTSHLAGCVPKLHDKLLTLLQRMVHPLDLVAHHSWHIAVGEVACLEDLKKTSLSDRSVPDYDQLLHLQLVGHLCLQQRLCSDLQIQFSDKK